MSLRQLVVKLGVDRWLRWVAGGRGVILMCHQLIRESTPRGWVADQGLYLTEAQLVMIITTLREEGYQILPFSTAIQGLLDGAKGPPFACLSFDDGSRDMYDLALPILVEHKAPAILYLTSGFIDRSHPIWWHGIERLLREQQELILEWEDGRQILPTETPETKGTSYRQILGRLFRLPLKRQQAVLAALERRYSCDFLAWTEADCLNWPMVHEMLASGLIEIGGHTVSHPNLAAMPEDQAQWEITVGRERLATALRQPIHHFAYPIGDPQSVSRREVAMMQTMNWTSAVLACGGPIFPKAAHHTLTRVPFGGNDQKVNLRLRLTGLGRMRYPDL